MNQKIDRGTIRADLDALERNRPILTATDDDIFIMRYDLQIDRLRALLAA